MAALLDACRFTPTLGGTTDWTYFAAVTGYQSPAAANVVNGRLYKYRAESADLSQWEIGEGAYNTGTGVLARTTVLFNSLGTTAKVSFSTVPQVAIVALKEDLVSVEEANSFTSAQQDQIRKNTAQFTGGGYSNLIALTTGANTISITADAVALFNSSGNIFGATSVSLSLNMASSGGPNLLDTGSVATAQYHYFVIYNPTTGTVASLASLSATAPTMPSGYTYKRRIGWINYNAGITAFVQRNNSFAWVTPRQVTTGATGQTNFSLSTFVPPTASLVRGFMSTNNNNVNVSDNIGNVVFVINAAPANACTWTWQFVLQNGPLQISYGCNSSGGNCGVTGWDDNI